MRDLTRGGEANGHDGNDTIRGGRFHDILDGGPGDDAISAGTGADKLFGGGGNDILDAGRNPARRGDSLLGGEGDDTYMVDSPFDLVDEGVAFPTFAGSPADIDTIISTADWFWDVYSVAERLVISETAVDVPFVPGTTIIGSAFSNEMVGNSHDNWLFGRGGSDTYRAGAGNDSISFSTLGLTEENSYVGVDGVNTLVMEAGNGYDLVYEFEVGKDKIDVSAYGYGSAEEVLALGVDDGFGNSYFALGDGFDYAYLIGVNRESVTATDFIV